MNSALNYFQGYISDFKSDFSEDLQKENSQLLYKESNKISVVLEIMNFWKSECQIDFHANGTDGLFSLEQKERCFSSCSAKTFEVKQMESFHKDMF
jgi:hypothetical protein